MKYFIKRELSEYGPYSLAELQQYLQSGQIVADDLCRSEGMTDWVPVSQVVGNITVPPPLPQGGYAGAAPALALDQTPAAPNLHWGAVLAIGICTCGLFGTIWLLVLANYVKKVDANSRAMLWMILSVAAYWAFPIFSSIVWGETRMQALNGISYLTGFGFYLAAVYSMKSSFEDYYLNRSGYVRGLSGVMVFFFAPYYFQYHVNETEKVRAQAAGQIR